MLPIIEIRGMGDLFIVLNHSRANWPELSHLWRYTRFNACLFHVTWVETSIVSQMGQLGLEKNNKMKHPFLYWKKKCS